MKKLLTILLVFFCGLAMAQTGENPPSGTKILQAPNSPTFLFYQPDTSIWISMGAYGKAELQRANKKYPIWNHSGISNTGWSPSKVLGFNVDGDLVPVAAGSGSMTYPGAGIALSTGSAWGTSITDNSANWNTAYNDRLKWDGGSTGLVAATGRTSLGGTTIGQSMFTLANPSAVRFPRFNADNTVSALSASDFKTAIGVSDYVFGVSINSGAPSTVYDGNVLNFNGGTNVTLSQSGNDITINSTGGGTMVYPGAGIPLSTGSAWGTSITDNSSNWNTAYSNRIATFTTTGNSGAATFSGNTLNIPNYTLAGLGGIGEAPTGQVHYRTNTGWVAATLAATYYTNKVELFYTATQYEPLDAATTSLAGVMTSTDKTNLNAFTSNKSNYDAAYTNMGKVTVGGGVAYGDMSSTYFSIIGGAIIPTRDSSPTDGSSLPITSNAVYDGLALKADLSGAAFTGAISSTSTMTATDFIRSSDRRLKSHIKPIQKLDWTNKVKWKQFHIKEDPEQRLHYGVLAQDIELIAPHLVYEDSVTHKKAVAYIDLLIAKIAVLETRVAELEETTVRFSKEQIITLPKKYYKKKYK